MTSFDTFERYYNVHLIWRCIVYIFPTFVHKITKSLRLSFDRDGSVSLHVSKLWRSGITPDVEFVAVLFRLVGQSISFRLVDRQFHSSFYHYSFASICQMTSFAMIVLCSACTCRGQELRCSDIEASTIKESLQSRKSLGFNRAEFVNVSWGRVGVDCRAFEGVRLSFEGSCARMIGPASSCRKVTINCIQHSNQSEVVFSFIRNSTWNLVIKILSLSVIVCVLFNVRRIYLRVYRTRFHIERYVERISRGRGRWCT